MGIVVDVNGKKNVKKIFIPVVNSLTGAIEIKEVISAWANRKGSPAEVFNNKLYLLRNGRIPEKLSDVVELSSSAHTETFYEDYRRIQFAINSMVSVAYSRVGLSISALKEPIKSLTFQFRLYEYYDDDARFAYASSKYSGGLTINTPSSGLINPTVIISKGFDASGEIITVTIDDEATLSKLNALDVAYFSVYYVSFDAYSVSQQRFFVDWYNVYIE